MKRMIVAITGASGAIIGIRLLEELSRNPDVETYLVISRWGERTIELETAYTVEQVRALADRCCAYDDLAAPISSGSFPADACVIVPCSMKTLAGIAMGFSDTLVGRAADVALKERRKLVLVPRETPLSTIHLKNMETVSQMGAVILPLMAGFYFKPRTIEDMIDFFVGKILDAVGIEHHLYRRWTYEKE